MATHPDWKIWCYSSEMILNVHSNALYLSIPTACSHTIGIFFLGSLPQQNKPILLNGARPVLCTILQFVTTYTTEAKLCALCLNAKEAKIMRLALEELGHPQPPTPIHVDNLTTVGNVSNTVKRQKSKTKFVQFSIPTGFWESCRLPYLRSYHQAVRPFYLHMTNSPRFLERAEPSIWRGCVVQSTPTH